MIPFGALSWTYLSKPIIWMRHREFVVYFIFASYFLNKSKAYLDRRNNHSFIEARIYTHDESDISFKERTNKSDSAVSREKILAFRESVLKERVNKEREAMIDAYDYLYGTNLNDTQLDD